MPGLFLLLVVVIPFGTKKFLGTFNVLPEGDYFHIFLYFSDILILVFLAGLIFWRREFFLDVLRTVWREHKFLVVFLILALISVLFALNKALAFYGLLRLVFLVFLFGATVVFIKRKQIKPKHILGVILGVSIFEAFLGIFQFLLHGSVGLGFFGSFASKIIGEPLVTPMSLDAGRIFVDGGEFLRAFGTMPHANIFAAFIILGLIAIYYAWLKQGLWRGRVSAAGFLDFLKKFVWKRALMGVGIFFLLLSLVLSFSRSGWIVFFIVTVLLLTWGLFREDYRKSSLTLLVVLVTCSLLLVSILGWLILPRAGFEAGEPSVSYRILYNNVGIETILEKPWGVGLGGQAVYGADVGLYQKRGVEKPWQFQPVHNLFILVGAETGILGGLAFVIFLATLFWRALRKIKDGGLETFIYILPALSLLLFGLVDHFMWTLWSGQLMLWLSLGMLAGTTSPRSSTDRA